MIESIIPMVQLLGLEGEIEIWAYLKIIDQLGHKLFNTDSFTIVLTD